MPNLGKRSKRASRAFKLKSKSSSLTLALVKRLADLSRLK